MWGEGRLLASTSYGAKILLTLGQVYELQADISRGGRPACCTWTAAWSIDQGQQRALLARAWQESCDTGSACSQVCLRALWPACGAGCTP